MKSIFSKMNVLISGITAVIYQHNYDLPDMCIAAARAGISVSGHGIT